MKTFNFLNFAHTVLYLLHKFHLWIPTSLTFIRVRWQQENHSLHFDLKSSPIKEKKNHEENVSYDSTICIHFYENNMNDFLIAFHKIYIFQSILRCKTFSDFFFCISTTKKLNMTLADICSMWNLKSWFIKQ